MSPAEIQQLEQRLEQLRIRYEQYFLGIEKMEPATDRTKLKRAILQAVEDPTNNTAVRFRLGNLKQKMATLENYWNRINKQIEEGTYRRHQFKAKLHEQMAAEQRGGGGAGHVDLSDAGSGSAYDDVVSKYRQLQQQSGQEPVAPERLAAMLQKQERQLREKYGARKVEFRVTVEDGKPKLKARPVR